MTVFGQSVVTSLCTEDLLSILVLGVLPVLPTIEGGSGALWNGTHELGIDGIWEILQIGKVFIRLF